MTTILRGDECQHCLSTLIPMPLSIYGNFEVHNTEENGLGIMLKQHNHVWGPIVNGLYLNPEHHSSGLLPIQPSSIAWM